MNLIRPEAAAVLSRWREVLAGLVVALIGVWLITNRFGALYLIGWGLSVGGFSMMIAGIRHARFPAGSGGPGIIELDERKLTYFSPETGGSVSLDDLLKIAIRTTDAGPFVSDMFWEWTDTTGQTLAVPSDAEGSEQIFDALSALDDVDYDAVMKASGEVTENYFVVWKRPKPLLH
ncbi:MAG: hypothetical protein ACR2O1_03600 [Boseongicola sp.]